MEPRKMEPRKMEPQPLALRVGGGVHMGIW